MSFASKLVSIALVGFNAVDALKVGLLSDAHLHLRYDPDVGPRIHSEGDCYWGAGEPSHIHAPMGRYGCDPPVILLEQLMNRMHEKYGKQDVIFLTGDLVAKHIAMPTDEEDAEHTYALLLESLGYLNEILAAKFPDTIILPAFGNNDTKYHDNPIPDDDAPFFYSYVFNLWFKMLPGNTGNLSESQIDEIHKTFDIGGFYRVDLNDKISVLAINTLYYDSERTRIDSTESGVEQMYWFGEQLEHAEEGRKFIIISHVYAGSRYNSHPMWFSYPNLKYFQLLERHKDKVIIEIGGHDHFTSMRYHTKRDIMDTKSPTATDDSLYHNMLVNPSATPWYGNNPGISAIEIDDETLIPHNYHATFLNLKKTLDKPTRTPYKQLEWRDCDYTKEYGIDELTPQGIHELRIKLQKDPKLQ